jgi:nitrilase
MKIASIQMVASCDLSQNLLTAERLITKAAQSNCQLAVLPEYFCLLGRTDHDKLSIQEPYNKGPIQDRLADIARKNKIYIVAGTLPISSENPMKVFNSSIVFDPQGQPIFRYDKIHLFSFSSKGESYDESKTLFPGKHPSYFDIQDQNETWRFGLSVCYDLRFPEIYRAMGEVDAQIIPAAFTYTTGKVHWEILLRARAIENQCYVIASAQGGIHENGRRTWGHSMIINPWGEIDAILDEGEGFISFELSKAMIHEIRNKLPALKHRTLS